MSELGGSTKIASIIITEPEVLTADFTANPTTVKKDSVVMFSNLTSGATTYSWKFGDGDSSSLFEPAHTYGDVGLYTITLNASNDRGCVQSKQIKDYITVTDITSVNNFTQGAVRIYPNPANGKLLISVPEGHEINDIMVFDLLGKNVTSIIQIAKNGSSASVLDIHLLSDGLYFVKVMENSLLHTYMVNVVVN